MSRINRTISSQFGEKILVIGTFTLSYLASAAAQQCLIALKRIKKIISEINNILSNYSISITMQAIHTNACLEKIINNTKCQKQRKATIVPKGAQTILPKKYVYEQKHHICTACRNMK